MNEAAEGSPSKPSVTVRPRTSARSIATRNSARVSATSASPKRRKAALWTRTCPRPHPYEIAGTTAHQRLEHRQASGRVHEHVARREPLGHDVGEALDPNARIVPEPRAELRQQRLVPAAEADDASDRGNRERLGNRSLDIADAPAASGHENDLARGGKTERAPRGGLRTRNAECGRRESVHAVHRRVRSDDRAHFPDRLRVRNEVHVDTAARPVVQRGQIGDRGHHGDAQPSRAPQSAEHLGDVRIHGHDHVGIALLLDQPQQPASAEAREQPLRELTGRRGSGREPEPDIPNPFEPVEDDVRSPLAGEGDRATHHGEAVLDVDLAIGSFLTELGGERTRRQIVPLADAGGQDENARRHGGQPTAPSVKLGRCSRSWYSSSRSASPTR